METSGRAAAHPSHRQKFVSRKKKKDLVPFFAKRATVQALWEVWLPCERRTVSPFSSQGCREPVLQRTSQSSPLICLSDYIQVCTVCLHTWVTPRQTYAHPIGRSVFHLTHQRTPCSCSHVCLCLEKQLLIRLRQSNAVLAQPPSPSFIEFQTQSMLLGNCTVNQCLSKPRQ